MAYYHFVIIVLSGLQTLWLAALHNRGVVKWEPLWVIWVSWLGYLVDLLVPEAEWIRPKLVNGEFVDWTRAAGWMCTCPVLILFLVSMTTFGGREASVRVVPLLVANQVMFITGITSAICSDDEGSARWWFYGIGCTAGAYVLAASGLCFRSLYSFFKDESARNLVLALGVFFFIGWGVFPIAWTFGHSGLDMVDGLVTGTVYLIGDILAKNLFVITAVVLKARHLTDRPQPWSFLLPWDRASSRWGGLVEQLNTSSTAPPGESPSNSAAAAHAFNARKGAARKLIENRVRVLRDITRRTGPPASQPQIVPLPGEDVQVDACMFEVAKRLLGSRGSKGVRLSTVAQASTWIATTEYLSARLQSSTEDVSNIPGHESRKPDMNVPAGLSMRAVLAEVTEDAQNLRWECLNAQLGMELPESDDTGAGSVSKQHNYEARKEGAYKLISNHTKVINDVVRPDGPPPSQPRLVRLPRKEHQVDACLYEVARRLLGAQADPRDRLLTTKSAGQAATWIATCNYMSARIHSSPKETMSTPGHEYRQPDMNEDAATATKAVLAEVAAEQQSLLWDRFNDTLISSQGAGAAVQYDYGARKEAARKMLANMVKVVYDICRADGPPTTQQGLVRLPGVEFLVEFFLEEVCRRLLGDVPSQQFKPTNGAQAATWIATAEFLSARIHSSTQEMENTPGFEYRQPDMSEEAGAAVKAVLAELTLEQQNFRWSLLRQEGGSANMSVEGFDNRVGTVFNNYEARNEAAHKLMSNHLKVIADICRADGPPLTQKGLVRLPRKEHQVDACIYEVTRRLKGGRLDQRDRLLTTKSAAQAGTWIATCEYLSARLHSSAEEVANTLGFKQRKPDMSPGAAAVMKAVLAEVAAEQQSLRWDRFSEPLGDSQGAYGAAGQYDFVSRRAAAQRLITNHTKILNDIVRADGPPPTQPGLVRLPGVESLVEAALEEVSRRLLGGLPYQHVRPTNGAQAATWIATAEFLSARIHSSPEEVENTPGFEHRTPDMSFASGAAVKAVLAELTLECLRLRWGLLKEQLDAGPAPSEARKEAAHKMMDNHVKVLYDITRIDGPPSSQPRLVRLPRKEHQVDACLYEVTRRLIGGNSDPRDRLLTTKGAAQAATWIATAQYLSARIHSSPKETMSTPGHEYRQPDMSEEAGAAMKGVLTEILLEQQNLRWERFNETLKVSPILIGAAGLHDLDARREAAHKMLTNHVKVLNDIVRADGPPPTQPGLVRLPGVESLVEAALEEVSRRLLGGLPYQHVRPTNGAQAATWIATAEFLSARIHSSTQEMENTPGFEYRKPDMSEEAGAAVKAVLAELTLEQQNFRWSLLKGELGTDGSNEANSLGAAAYHNYQARNEAAHKLMSNHLKVIADICRADGPPLTQKGLVRLPRKEHQVDACIYEVTRRLSGGRPDPRDRLLTTKSAAQAGTWIATCEYLSARIHSSAEEVANTRGFEQRKPDMSPGAAAAMKAVLAEVAADPADEEAREANGYSASKESASPSKSSAELPPEPTDVFNLHKFQSMKNPSMNDLSKLAGALDSSYEPPGESTPTGRSEHSVSARTSDYRGSGYQSPVRPPRPDRRPSLGNIALDDVGFGRDLDLPTGEGPVWEAAMQKLAQAKAQAAAAMLRLSNARDQEGEFAPETGLVRFV